MLTKVFKLDDNGDLDISTGKIVVLEGKDSLIQRVKTRLQTFRGECFLEPTVGVPWFQSVFSRKLPKASALTAAINSALETVAGIRSVSGHKYNYDKSTRGLDISFKLTSETADTVSISTEMNI